MAVAIAARDRSLVATEGEHGVVLLVDREVRWHFQYKLSFRHGIETEKPVLGCQLPKGSRSVLTAALGNLVSYYLEQRSSEAEVRWLEKSLSVVRLRRRNHGQR